jgi:hypothetical protein
MDMETVFGLAFILPVFGLLVMTVMPKDWQNIPGWLMVSYLGLPGFVAVLGLLANMPLLIGGVLFLLGIAAVSKK